MGVCQIRLQLFAVLLTLVTLCKSSVQEDDFNNAKCGSVVEKEINTDDTVNVDLSHLVGGGSLPAGCQITWKLRLKLVEAQKTQNFGLLVTGDVNLQDKSNDELCTESEVQVTDFEGDEPDTYAKTQSYCNSEPVEFTTYQDTVLIHLRISEHGASGSGFNLNIKPFYACGGVFKLTNTEPQSIIRSPGYSGPYPENILCMWSFSFPSNTNGFLQCDYFFLGKKRYGRCRDNLSVFGKTSKSYCAKQLKKKMKIPLGSQSATIVFRTDEIDDRRNGFQCRVFLG